MQINSVALIATLTVGLMQEMTYHKIQPNGTTVMVTDTETTNPMEQA
jgi:hypothetical protein